MVIKEKLGFDISDRVTQSGFDKDYVPFSLWTKPYELGLDSLLGINLSELKRGEELPDSVLKHCRELVPFFGKPEFEWVGILEKFIDVDFPNSMFIKDFEELEKHVAKIHQVMYAHYVLGKFENLKNSNTGDFFPNNCCGNSSGNVVRSLLGLDYSSAIRAINRPLDHTYVVIPFLIDGSKEGIIVADPTSDQLFPSLNGKAPRNSVSVFFKREFFYNTEWCGGDNLYPSLAVVYSPVMRFETSDWRDCKAGIINLKRKDMDFDHYLSAAFSNPIKI